MTDVPTIVYELALRSLDQQERELGELRARTNTVLAAAALITSLLGTAAIRESGLSESAIVALVVFGVTGGVSLFILWPRTIRFAFDARGTYNELYASIDNVAEAQLRVAFGAHDRYLENKTIIDGLEVAFQCAVFTLGIQALAWVVALAVV